VVIQENNLLEHYRYLFYFIFIEPRSISPTNSDHADLSHLGATGGGGQTTIDNPSSQQNDDVLREKLKHMGKSK
jgi:hypothetical protein